MSEVELAQVESQYQQALAAIPALEQQIAAQENLISVLLGRNPGPIPRGRPIGDFPAPGIPGDLPSTLLERRPDILQAEQILVATNADIGAAKALYFPTLSLTGLLGSVSTAFGDFLTGPAGAWTLAAGLAGPIFTFGQIEGQVQTAEASQRAALANYQQVIFNAFRETNDALVGTVKKREEATAQVRARHGAPGVCQALAAAIRQRLRGLHRGAVRRERAVQPPSSPRCARRPTATRRS